MPLPGANLSYGNLITGCPEHWVVHNHSCYYMTGEESSKLDDAQEKCRIMSAKLPIIKSESENTFILGLLSKEKSWVWLGMKRRNGKMVWLDDTPAEPSDGALYSAWQVNEPSKSGHEGCAYLNFYEKKWNDNSCHYPNMHGPYVLCQKALV